MARPHYLIRRSRSGRFNFTLIASEGRITGFVMVATEGRTRDDIEQEARRKIDAIAGELAQVVGTNEPSDRAEHRAMRNARSGDMIGC